MPKVLKASETNKLLQLKISQITVLTVLILRKLHKSKLYNILDISQLPQYNLESINYKTHMLKNHKNIFLVKLFTAIALFLTLK